MIKFLVIDDSKSLRNLYEVLLKNRYKNVSVDEAANGEEALSHILNSDYSLIITDVNMPVMDGIEFYEKLKVLRPLLAGKVCFTSASSIEDQSCMIREGCSFLPKPFVIKDFYNLVEGMLDSEEREFHFSGGELKKRTKRFKVKESCVLDLHISYYDMSANVKAEVVDYSKYGLGLKYSGQEFLSGTQVDISVKSLNIFDKRGEVVWSRHLNGDIQSGIHWI